MTRFQFPFFAHRPLMGAVLAALLPVMAQHAVAQTSPATKSVVAEAIPAFSALNQWVSTYVLVLPEPAPVAAPQVQAWYSASAAPQPFEPHPVIVGLPDLPLTGATAARAGQKWDGTLNYQGVHMSLVVVDGKGRLIQKPLSTPVAVGERFKIRITPTFDAVSELDQLVGEAWSSQRTGQAYPNVGTSVAIKAGQTVDLPLDSNHFFAVDGKTANERLVISVRHPRALKDAASAQPNYRLDGERGSSYLQLVPAGKQPMVEQVITVQSR